MKQSKTNPTTTKRSSSADSKRANSPILSPVKEETSSEFKSPSQEDNTPEFSHAQQTFIHDLLDKQAHIFARQQDDDNRYREDQIDRLMAQMSNMNDRIEHGMAPQTPHTPTVTIHERIMMETPKVQRPHDLAYHELMASSSKAPVPPTPPAITTTNSLEESMEKLLTSMGSFLTHSKKDDNATELPKFHGGDAQWPQWYQLLRSYLQAKGWLSTFDHVTGPGTLAQPTPDFDLDKNTKIYQKLHSKCYEGTASTYVRMAAEFDGHGAGKQLKERYNKKSPPTT